MCNLVLQQVRAFDPFVHSIQAGLANAPLNDASIKADLEQSIAKLANLARIVDEIRNCAMRQLRAVYSNPTIKETSYVPLFGRAVVPLNTAFSSLNEKNPNLQPLEKDLSNLKGLSRKDSAKAILFLEQTYPISQVLHRQLETLQTCQLNYSSRASNPAPAVPASLLPQAPSAASPTQPAPPSPRESAISISTVSDNSSASFAIEPAPVDPTYQAHTNALALRLRLGLISSPAIPMPVQNPISVKSTAPGNLFPQPSSMLLGARLRLGQTTPPKNLSYLTQLRTNSTPIGQTSPEKFSKSFQLKANQLLYTPCS